MRNGQTIKMPDTATCDKRTLTKTGQLSATVKEG